VKKNYHENFTILKREIIHSSLSPLYVQKVAMKFILYCRGHPNDDSCKKQEKLNDRFFGGTWSCNTLIDVKFFFQLSDLDSNTFAEDDFFFFITCIIISCQHDSYTSITVGVFVLKHFSVKGVIKKRSISV
jgi:hypothetical protein